MEPSSLDFSSWIPSVVLAGMLALFQGKDAPIPRHYLPQVRLAASLVLFTSAYLLFSDKSDNLSPRKLNAMMVFGFVLNYYFGPRNFLSQRRYPNNMDAVDIPLGQALYKEMKEPTAIDVARNKRCQKTSNQIPEGWGMQVNGGDYMMGNQRSFRGRSKLPRKKQPKSKYVLERIGSWSSAEDSLQYAKAKKYSKTPVVKPYHAEEDFDDKEVKTWEGLSGEFKRNPLPPELINCNQIKKAPIRKKKAEKHSRGIDNAIQEIDKEHDKLRNAKSVAVVQNLTTLAKPSVFHIDPIEASQIRLANNFSAQTYPRQYRSVGGFKIKINSPEEVVTNVKNDNKSTKPNVEKKPVRQIPTMAMGSMRFSTNLSARPFCDERKAKSLLPEPEAISYPQHAIKPVKQITTETEDKIEEKQRLPSKEERRRSMELTMRKNSLIAARKRRQLQNIGIGRRRSRSLEFLPPNMNRRSGSLERTRKSMSMERPKRSVSVEKPNRRMSLERSKKSMSVEKPKRRPTTRQERLFQERLLKETPVSSHFHTRVVDHRRRPLKTPVKRNSRTRRNQSVWKESFDDDRSFRRRRPFSPLELLSRYRNLIFFGLIVLSHVGFYILMQNYSPATSPNPEAMSPPPPTGGFFRQRYPGPVPNNKLRSSAAEVNRDDNWVVKSQIFAASPIDDTASSDGQPTLPLNHVDDERPEEQSFMTGYIEAFLFFSLVKITVDCVDKFYSSPR